MVYQDDTGLNHFLINVIPFISNSVRRTRHDESPVQCTSYSRTRKGDSSCRTAYDLHCVCVLHG